MKLIIDLSEKDYEIFKELTPHYIDFMYYGADERLILATRNGIPLDKIRAEITAIAINGQVDEHTLFIRAGEQVKQMALDIIDKYRKE